MFKCIKCGKTKSEGEYSYYKNWSRLRKEYYLLRKKTCKVCKKIKDKRYKNRFKEAAYNRKREDQIRFGGKKQEVFKRDGYKCVICGMTMEQHQEKWGCDLTVHHIDGEGRYSESPNHDINNLETLCKSCHGARDWETRKHASSKTG